MSNEGSEACGYGHQSVWREASDWVRYTLDKQRAKGFEEYGQELLPHHPGRDLWQDLMDEICDAANYASALRQAWYCQRDELELARARIARLEDEVADLQSDLRAAGRRAQACRCSEEAR